MTITADESLINGNTPTHVHADITGLEPGEPYYFRVVAATSNEEILGDYASLT